MAKQLTKTETNRREKFCLAYVMNGNQGAAAVREAGYSDKLQSSWVQASRLLRDVTVQKRIEELQEEWHEQLVADHKRVLREVSGMALFDPAKMFDEDGCLLQLHEMDPATRKMVNEIEIILSDEDNRGIRVAKLKYGKDKRAYLDMLMKHYNQYEAHRVAGSVQPVTVYLHEADADL